MLSLIQLLDDEKCYEVIRGERWPQGVRCPHCDAQHVIKQGKDDTQRARQRYRCLNCTKKFDDLTSTVFASHHQPLQLWVACLYLMGLNVSNRQIAQELGLNVNDVQDMTRTLRRGVVDVSTTPTLAGTVEIDEVYIVAGHKGQPQEVEEGARWTKTTSERQAWAWHRHFRQAAGPGHHRAWRSVDLASV